MEGETGFTTLASRKHVFRGRTLEYSQSLLLFRWEGGNPQGGCSYSTSHDTLDIDAYTLDRRMG